MGWGLGSGGVAVVGRTICLASRRAVGGGGSTWGVSDVGGSVVERRGAGAAVDGLGLVDQRALGALLAAAQQRLHFGSLAARLGADVADVAVLGVDVRARLALPARLQRTTTAQL